MIQLHGYWRSGASYRVRVALNLKGIAYEQVTHDLRTGAQRDPAYLRLQPQGLVPALVVDETTTLIQSPAILEWLEERYPDPPLLPPRSMDRAIVRAMAAIVGCDIHPLNNQRVLKSIRNGLHADNDTVDAWVARWIVAGFAALEPMIAQYGGRFAFGDTPTLADVYLVPQVYSADRFGIDMAAYPHLVKAVDKARELPAFAAAHPLVQPDADPG